MVRFFDIEKDSGGRVLRSTYNERLSIEFVVSVAIDELADVDDRINATKWLGHREERYGFFHAVQLSHVQSPCQRVRDNVCVNLLASVGTEKFLLYLPTHGNYRDRFLSAMRASKSRVVRWTLLIVRHELGEQDLKDSLLLAYSEFEERRHLYVRRSFDPETGCPAISAGDLLRQAFRIALGIKQPRRPRQPD